MLMRTALRTRVEVSFSCKSLESGLADMFGITESHQQQQVVVEARAHVLYLNE